MGLFDSLRRAFRPNAASKAESEADEHAELAALIFKPLYLQIVMAGKDVPLPSNGPTGFGRASGYIFAFSVAVFTAAKIFDPNRRDRLLVVVALVFRSIYGDERGEEIMEATARANPQTDPDAHVGYERGGWDAKRWVSGNESAGGLIPILNGFDETASMLD